MCVCACVCVSVLPGFPRTSTVLLKTEINNLVVMNQVEKGGLLEDEHHHHLLSVTSRVVTLSRLDGIFHAKNEDTIPATCQSYCLSLIKSFHPLLVDYLRFVS